MFIVGHVNFCGWMYATKGNGVLLFNKGGLGVMGNGDRVPGKFNPLLPNASGRPAGVGPTTSGIYYLGVVNWRHDPVDAGNLLIFADQEGPGVIGPTGPGNGNPLDHWQNTTAGDGAGTYSITLTRSTFANPEPAAMSPYGLGVV